MAQRVSVQANVVFRLHYRSTHVFVLVQGRLKILVVTELDISIVPGFANGIERDLHSGDLSRQAER